ncbi:hypothetical protein ACTHSL_13780, partial [Neisseria sp. P0008.S010]|uniref:hypothetical protein n=1 Tax=Neisseria sp. P0008.S010 TaxID=3436707 RepID=UPI003F7CF8C8
MSFITRTVTTGPAPTPTRTELPVVNAPRPAKAPAPAPIRKALPPSSTAITAPPAPNTTGDTPVV